jgi:LmbE family N-acetylglucosaminyl deacetylase
MRVLAVGAHPDDVELLCSGTLARYANDGHEVSIAIATDGAAGEQTGTKEETARTREDEARKAAEIIGAELVWMGFEDGFLFDDRATRLAFVELLRRTRPDAVFVHSSDDYHPDHRAAARMAVDARIAASAAAVQTASPATKGAPHYFLMDTIGGVDFEPEAFVDITPVMETKRRMLAAHTSQMGSLSIPGTTYATFMERQVAFRGQQAGVGYAEGFRSLRTHPPTSEGHLLLSS